MPIVEIGTWILSDAYLADPSIIEKGFEYLKKTDGCRSIYWGISEQLKVGESKRAYLFVEWKTYEHHKSIMDLPGYPDFIGFVPTIGGGGSMKHVDFAAGESYDNYLRAVNAPGTEILILTAKTDEGKTGDDVMKAVAPLVVDVERVNAKYSPVASGVTLEGGGDEYVALVGWESVKHHFETLAAHPSMTASVKNIFAVATPQMAHATLKKVY